MNPYITLIITITSNVVGQVLLKKGMLNAGKIPSTDLRNLLTFLIKTMILNPFILSGLFLAVFSTMCWMVTVSKLSLGFAYSFVSLAFPLVMLMSVVFFKENVSITTWIGMAILMIGLFVIAKG